MFDIFKKLREQKEELETATRRCTIASNVSNHYCGWTFAYKNAIWAMCQEGTLTVEQRDTLLTKAKEYYDYWENN